MPTPTRESTIEHVAQWLTNVLSLPEHAPTFIENHIDGNVLLDLTMDELKNDLNISSLGHRKRIWKAIQELKEFEKGDLVAQASDAVASPRVHGSDATPSPRETQAHAAAPRQRGPTAYACPSLGHAGEGPQAVVRFEEAAIMTGALISEGPTLPTQANQTATTLFERSSTGVERLGQGQEEQLSRQEKGRDTSEAAKSREEERVAAASERVASERAKQSDATEAAAVLTAPETAHLLQAREVGERKARDERERTGKERQASSLRSAASPTQEAAHEGSPPEESNATLLRMLMAPQPPPQPSPTGRLDRGANRREAASPRQPEAAATLAPARRASQGSDDDDRLLAMLMPARAPPRLRQPEAERAPAPAVPIPELSPARAPSHSPSSPTTDPAHNRSTSQRPSRGKLDVPDEESSALLGADSASPEPATPSNEAHLREARALRDSSHVHGGGEHVFVRTRKEWSSEARKGTTEVVRISTALKRARKALEEAERELVTALEGPLRGKEKEHDVTVLHAARADLVHRAERRAAALHKSALQALDAVLRLGPADAEALVRRAALLLDLAQCSAFLATAEGQARGKSLGLYAASLADTDRVVAQVGSAKPSAQEWLARAYIVRGEVFLRLQLSDTAEGEFARGAEAGEVDAGAEGIVMAQAQLRTARANLAQDYEHYRLSPTQPVITDPAKGEPHASRGGMLNFLSHVGRSLLLGPADDETTSHDDPAAMHPARRRWLAMPVAYNALATAHRRTTSDPSIGFDFQGLHYEDLMFCITTAVEYGHATMLSYLLALPVLASAGLSTRLHQGRLAKGSVPLPMSAIQRSLVDVVRVLGDHGAGQMLREDALSEALEVVFAKPVEENLAGDALGVCQLVVDMFPAAHVYIQWVLGTSAPMPALGPPPMARALSRSVPFACRLMERLAVVAPTVMADAGTLRTGRGETLLHLAVLAEERVAVEFVLSHPGLRGDINAAVAGTSKDESGFAGDTALLIACTRRHADIVEALLMRGASLAVRGRFGDTPLHRACRFSNMPVLSLLHAFDSDFHERLETLNAARHTPLHTALRSEDDHWKEVVRYLQENNADIAATDEHEQTCLQYLLMYRSLEGTGFERLLRAILDMATHNPHESLLRFMTVHAVVRDGNAGLLRVMLEGGANGTGPLPDSGRTPLHIAPNAAVAKVLLAHGGDWRARDKLRGDTPLHVACRDDHSDVVQVLLGAGAEFGRSAVNSEGVTPLNVAGPWSRAVLQKAAQLRGAEVSTRAGTGGKEGDVWRPELVAPMIRRLQEKKRTAGSLPRLLTDSNPAPVARAGRASGAHRVTAHSVPPARAPGPAAESATQALTKPAVLPLSRGSATTPTVKSSASTPTSGTLGALSADVAVAVEERPREEEPTLVRIDLDISSFPMHALPWDVLVSEVAMEGLFAANTEHRRRLLEEIRELASGKWTPARARPITSGKGKGQQIPDTLALHVLYAETLGSLCIIWEKGLDYSPRRRAYADTIRVWAVLPRSASAELQETVASIVAAHNLGRSGTLSRVLCRADVGATGELHLPVVYSPANADVPTALGTEPIPPGTTLYSPPAAPSADGRTHTIMKFFTLDATVVYAALKGREACPEIPFRLDEAEDIIVRRAATERSSVLVVGRSGTGKTTVMLARMTEQFLVARDANAERSMTDNEVVPLHQLFVTANAVLCDEVRKAFVAHSECVSLTPSGEAVQSGRVATGIPPSLLAEDVRENMFPLFIPAKMWLRLLDTTCQEPFFHRPEDFDASHSLSSLLTLSGVVDAVPVRHTEDESSRGRRRKKTVRQREVDFNYFVSQMWPRMAHLHRGAYAPSTVFTEIMSYIKGSAQSLRNATGHLSAAEYDALPRKMNPVFAGGGTIEETLFAAEGSRRHLYAMYERYEVLKREAGAYDLNDLVHHIFRDIVRHGYSGVPVHAVFVDEVQDFTQAELQLLVLVCQNKNGMFLTGDTCQTIARGVGFRFEDLQSMFYRMRSVAALAGAGPTHVEIGQPPLLELATNYRTHSGILDCAAVCVEILCVLFPCSVDKLERERAHFSGPKPLFLEDPNIESLVRLMGTRESNYTTAFGANQVILVRSDEAKSTLPSQFSGALVMTVREAKGLEFNDVFLYNFWRDSPARDDWRVVTHYELSTAAALGIELPVLPSGTISRPLAFDEKQHQLLCEELKQLYVALTRARERVIIFDQDVVKRAPMFEMLDRRHLIEVPSVLDGDSVFAKLAVASTTQEWQQRGITLFEERHFAAAAQCFRNSGHGFLERFARALDFCGKASSTVEAAGRRELFCKAAYLFLESTLLCFSQEAARCFVSAGEFPTAAELFCVLDRPSDAARCFAAAGDREAFSRLLDDTPGVGIERLLPLFDPGSTIDLEDLSWHEPQQNILNASKVLS